MSRSHGSFSRIARRQPLVKKLSIPLGLAYVGLAILANWLASKYVVSVGFGRMAPAGVFAIGAVLVLRDWIQQLAGLWYSLALVYVAGLSSWLVGDAAGWTSFQKVAIGSVVAFTISETVEAIVFTPIRRWSLTVGVALSATVGNALDSFVFLAIAFGSQHFFVGQFIGKSWMIIAGTALTLLRRRLAPVAAAT
jgi:queuosine precursor transporter